MAGHPVRSSFMAISAVACGVAGTGVGALIGAFDGHFGATTGIVAVAGAGAGALGARRLANKTTRFGHQAGAALSNLVDGLEKRDAAPEAPAAGVE